MAAGALVFELFFVAVITCLLLHTYGNWRRQHLFVTVSTFVGWYACFIIVCVLPLDVSLTFYTKCLHENIELDNSSAAKAALWSSSRSHLSTTPMPGAASATMKQPPPNMAAPNVDAAAAGVPPPRKSVRNSNFKSRVRRVARGLNPITKYDEDGEFGEGVDEYGNGMDSMENNNNINNQESRMLKTTTTTTTTSSTKGPAVKTTTSLVQAAEASANGSRLFSAADVSDKLRAHCEQPTNYINVDVILHLWRMVYWSSQVLCWLVLPVMQSYACAGDFHVVGKLKTALYENAIYYGSYLLVFGLLLIYVATKGLALDTQNLKVILISASNTWGLFLLVLLLGYGLVEVPRQIYLAGTAGHQLNKTYFDIEKLSTERNDAEEAVREAFRDTRDVLQALPTTHPYRAWADTIMQRFPVELAEQLGRSHSSAHLNSSLRDAEAANLAATNEKFLVRLHKRAITAMQAHHRTAAQWQALVQHALHLEEVAKNENAPKGMHRQFLRTYTVQRSAVTNFLCVPTIEWYWECVLKRPLLKLAGIIMALLSGLIVWSECTFFIVRPPISLAAVMVKIFALQYAYFKIEVCSLLFIFYMSLCAYYTVFRLRIYRYYHLDPHHMTDENSLLFSAILLCRLTPPLCLNFLGMIHLDSHVIKDPQENFGGVETAFTKLMGHMDVIPVVANGINVYLPMLILLFCVATYLQLGTRCLHAIGIDQFVTDDNMTTDMVNAGKALVAMERNRQQRDANRESRNEYWKERMGDTRAKYARGRGFDSNGVGTSEERVGFGDDYDDNDTTQLVAPSSQSAPALPGHDSRNLRSSARQQLAEEETVSFGDWRMGGQSGAAPHAGTTVNVDLFGTETSDFLDDRPPLVGRDFGGNKNRRPPKTAAPNQSNVGIFDDL